MSKKQYKIIFISGLAVVVLFWAFSQIQEKILSPELITAEKKPEVANISVTIITDDTILRLISHRGQSLYDMLTLAKENNQIKFSGKMYPGLGFFVTDIGTLHSGDGKNLLYYINGKEATVGVSAYALQDGDIVEWKLE